MPAWQDLLFSIGSVLFIVALIPTLTSDDKPPASTGFLTGGVLASFLIAYQSLGLWFSFSTTAVLSAMWLTVAVQSLKR